MNRGLVARILVALLVFQLASLLDVAMRTPPFAVKAHPLVEWTTTIVGSLFTTYLATSLMVDSFQTQVAWGPRLMHAAIMSGAFYAGTHFGQKAFVAISTKIKTWRDTQRTGDQRQDSGASCRSNLTF